MEIKDLWVFPRPRLNALSNNNHLGYAKITHPFHCFHGQKFQILRMINISGIETISLKHPTRGNFAVPCEWTDQAEPSAFEVLYPHFLDFQSLLEISELIKNFEQRSEKKA